jgi:hypothetical protein
MQALQNEDKKIAEKSKNRASFSQSSHFTVSPGIMNYSTQQKMLNPAQQIHQNNSSKKI